MHLLLLSLHASARPDPFDMHLRPLPPTPFRILLAFFRLFFSLDLAEHAAEPEPASLGGTG